MIAVGIDIGATKIAAALVGDDGHLTAETSVPTPAQAGADAVVTAALQAVHRVRTLGPDEGVAGIGVGTAGVVDPASGGIRSATAHIAGWAGTPLGRLLEEATGLPTRVVNDAHAHGLGEARYGAGRGVAGVLVIVAGTGLGGAFVRDGVLLTGAHGAAGHLGHVPSAEAAGMPCACGGHGHLECVASGAGLVNLARAHGLDVAGSREVVSAADAGDPTAGSCVGRSARALGAAIGGWVNVFDPDLVVLTGGLTEAGDRWWDGVRAAADRETVPATTGCPIVPAGLGRSAALVGAASLVLTPRSNGPGDQQELACIP